MNKEKFYQITLTDVEVKKIIIEHLNKEGQIPDDASELKIYSGYLFALSNVEGIVIMYKT